MLRRLKFMKFTTKLFTAITTVVIVSLLITSGNAIRLSKHGLFALGETALVGIHQGLYLALSVVDENMKTKLDGDILLLERKIASNGMSFLDDFQLIPATITNQETGETLKLEIPKLQAGILYLNDDTSIVDEIEELSGSLATVYQRVDDKLLRISSTVRGQDGNRENHTFIPSNDPVNRAVMAGEIFKGRIFMANDWYLTAFKPLRNSDDEVVGAIQVSQLMLSGQVRQLVSEAKVGPGYFYVYGEDGSMLIHPTMKPSDNILEIIPELNGPDGMVYYQWDGAEKQVYKQKIESWGVTLVGGMARADLVAGMDVMMLKNNLLVGLLVIAGGIGVSLMLVRSINKPLKALAEKAEKVGNGDYSIEFSSQVDDAIGQLTVALGHMVDKGKHMIEDIIHSSESLSSASRGLGKISDEMVHTAESTSEIASGASSNALKVSDAMATVSSAMEESTVNLDMIASASEEMGNTINEIAENSSRARQTTELAVSNAQRSHEAIVELGAAADDIGSITETITDISEQTNLLALNATIEAARAGEAGKGFAVVANEIKDLAQGTAKATGQIREAISGIQNRTASTVKEIEEITSVISDIDEIVNTIVTAVEEQSITTNEIVNNVTQASQGISEINASMTSSNTMTTEMSEQVGQVTERSRLVKESSEQVRTSADELSQLAERLDNLVHKFTV